MTLTLRHLNVCWSFVCRNILIKIIIFKDSVHGVGVLVKQVSAWPDAAESVRCT